MTTEEMHAVRSTLEIPERIRELIGLAKWDLWHGPMSAGNVEGIAWPGFVAAIEVLEDWFKDQPRTVYIEGWSGDYRFTDPDIPDECLQCSGTGEACGEACDYCDGEGVVYLDVSQWRAYDVKRAVFGDDLAPYIYGRESRPNAKGLRHATQ